MAGSFLNLEYLANDYQSKYWVKVQPETKTLTLDGRTNDDAGNNYVDHPYILTTGSSRLYRPVCRRVWFRFTGSLPAGYASLSTLSLPWIRPEGFAGFGTSTQGTYQGFPVQFIKKKDEHLI